jgi:hypothetical protein
MDALTLLRTFAAVLTILAALMVASNWSPRTMVAGFAVFIAASLAWIADGWLEGQGIVGYSERGFARDQRVWCVPVAAKSRRGELTWDY